MRLIDADKLIIEILTHDLIGDDEQVGKTILNAPTVEAIAVEWLMKKADEYIELGLNTVAKELNVIIAEWRKENASKI